MAAAQAQLSTAKNTTQNTTKNAALCADCGRVLSVSSREKDGESGAVGLLAGGAAGALLGNQVGSGTGKDLATLAGAVGGAYAGKKIEEKARSHTVWTVAVQFQDGSQAQYEFAQDPGFKSGDAVKKSGNSVVR
jgi:outer membrane lipoprotein SlyB